MSAAISVTARRLSDGPIISPTSHPSIGNNIQGPALIRVPEWVEQPLGRYYLDLRRDMTIGRIPSGFQLAYHQRIAREIR